jgi:hypothetical protein
MSLLSLLIALIIILVCFWAVRALLGAFSVGEPISTVVHVLLVLIVVFWLLSAFGLVGGGPVFRLR